MDGPVGERVRLRRHPTASELAATRVLRLPLAEASAEVRTGPPKNPANDVTLDVWAGELPLALRAGRSSRPICGPASPFPRAAREVRGGR